MITNCIPPGQTVWENDCGARSAAPNSIRSRNRFLQRRVSGSQGNRDDSLALFNFEGVSTTSNGDCSLEDGPVAQLARAYD